MKASRIRRQSTWLIALAVALSGLALYATRSRGQGDEGQAKTQSQVREVLRQALQETVDGHPAAVSLVEVRYPPGGSSKPHRHPGPVIGYVLEGTFEFQVNDGPLQTLHAGEAFYEPARALHQVSRNASKTEPARILAYMLIGAEDKQLVLPPD